MELFIEYSKLFVNTVVTEYSIDYEDNTLRGVVVDDEITFLKFSDYGIFLDNRYGMGYDIVKEQTGLRIKLKSK